MQDNTALIEYLFADRSAQDGMCLLWKAGKSNGYGILKYQGKTYPAHRLYWELTKGPIPKYESLGNLCGNRHCINPAHWQVGQDYTNAGRPPKLSMKDKLEIVELATSGGCSRSALAEQYGVSIGTIYNVISLYRER